MNIVNTISPEDQTICHTSEWLTLLVDAASQGLIGKTEYDSCAGRASICLLSDEALRNEACSLLRAGPAAGMALDAIAGAYARGDVVELRALDPAGGSPFVLCQKLDDPAGRTALEDFVRAHIGLRNLYIGINPRHADLAGGKKAASARDVVARRVAVLDFDIKDAPPSDQDWSATVAALKADLDPLLIVNSGNGTHVWLGIDTVASPDLTSSAGPLARAMARLGADNMANPAQIIRLPFTPNLPNAVKRARGAVVCLAAPLPGHNPAGGATRAARPLSDLCSALGSVASRLNLPGRAAVVEQSAASHIGADGGPKSGQAAPSADLLRHAMAELPNTDGGVFDDRKEWTTVCHAVKGAAQAGGIETEGREIWLDWCAKWGGDRAADELIWDSLTTTHTGWGTLMQLLQRENPAGRAAVKTAEANAAFAIATAATQAAFANSNFAAVKTKSPKNIPPRRWLYGRAYIGGFLSILAAPGGAGKSALAMVEAVAMASGLELIPNAQPISPLRVWMHNQEDDHDEMERRLTATLMHFNLNHADLKGNLFMTSGRDWDLKLARLDRAAPEIVPGVVGALVKRAQDENLDVIILDPLGALHTLPENSNEAANLLLGALRQVAHDTKTAIALLHHTSKAAAMDMANAGAGASRGASAFVDGARVVRQLERMPDTEAGRFGITPADRRDYLRVANGKANLARAEEATYLRMVGVKLGNGAGLWPDGDWVGVVERWTPPDTSGTAVELAQVQAAIKARVTPPRFSHRSPDWVGFVAADTLGLKIGPAGGNAKDRNPEEAGNYARVRQKVEGWLHDGSLRRIKVRDGSSRRMVDAVEVGTPAEVDDTLLLGLLDTDQDAGE